MPEEINRILTDHIATLLCCPTFAAIKHLANEGIQQGVHHVGDVMYDAALIFGKLADSSSPIMHQLNLNSRQFRLCTVHRAENTDNRERIMGIISAIKEISTSSFPTVLPLHPRTRYCLEKYGMIQSLENREGIHIIPPVSFLDMVMLENMRQPFLTDSGGRTERSIFSSYPLYYTTG